MTSEMTIRTEVDRNFEIFRQRLPELLPAHQGKFAVMHGGEIIDFFDTAGDAARFGVAKFGERYSVQEVTNRKVSLGFYSYAMHDISA